MGTLPLVYGVRSGHTFSSSHARVGLQPHNSGFQMLSAVPQAAAVSSGGQAWFIAPSRSELDNRGWPR